MEKRTVEGILRFYRHIDDEILMTDKEIKSIEELSYNPLQAFIVSFSPSGNKKSDPTAARALNMERGLFETVEELQRQKELYIAIRRAIRTEINGLPYYQKAVIKMFYFDGEKWEQIAEKLHYSPRQCKNIRTRALDRLRERFSKNKVLKSFFPIS